MRPRGTAVYTRLTVFVPVSAQLPRDWAAANEEFEAALLPWIALGNQARRLAQYGSDP